MCDCFYDVLLYRLFGYAPAINPVRDRTYRMIQLCLPPCYGERVVSPIETASSV